jgi:hypothetical protein
MQSKEKMAIVGSGLVVGGVGLGIVGIAMILPVVFAWTARLAEKSADRLAAKMEETSKTVGSVAGTLRRSFTQAARAGVEIPIDQRATVTKRRA